MRFTVLAVAMFVSVTAAAATPIDSTEPTLDIQLFHPAPGASNFFSVESGDVNSHLGFNSAINLNYARAPLAVRILKADGSEQDVGDVVQNRFDATVLLGVGFFGVVDLGLAMPVVVQGGFEKNRFEGAGIDLGLNSLPIAAQGDLRLVPKLRFLHLAEGSFSAAIIPTVILPTGSADYAHENDIVYAPSLALSGRGSMVRGAVNLGYRLRDRTKTATLIVDDEYFAKAALALDLKRGEGKPFEIVGEVFGHTPSQNPFAMNSTGIKKDFQRARTVVEGDVGVRMGLPKDLILMAGIGGGLMPGYGASSPRVFATMMYYTGEYIAQDTDKDGIPDSADSCPDKPEDLDTFEDSDGCPDLDNDKDNILDEDDQCPLEPEDKDNYNDEDGCPDPDNDNDGIPDEADKCPLDIEDHDGFQDDDGCPEPDNDNDGILDASDQCPLEAEDMDGYLDFDGCPEPDNDGDGLADLNDLCPNHAEDKDGVADDDGCPEDNDGDGIADDQDKCPNEPEVYNGIQDDDGCPEKLKTKSLVEVTEDKIEIKETVHFATGSAKILSKSFKLLDQVVSVLKNYKNIRKVRVEGHTDDRGPRKKNIKLSKDRAASVRKYLIDKGISADRLDFDGYGPEKPIASNKTAKGREMNRRVEFVIVESKPIGKDVAEDQPAPPPPPPPPGGDVGFEIEMPPVEAPTPASKQEPKKEEKPAEPAVEFNF